MVDIQAPVLLSEQLPACAEKHALTLFHSRPTRPSIVRPLPVLPRQNLSATVCLLAGVSVAHRTYFFFTLFAFHESFCKSHTYDLYYYFTLYLRKKEALAL